MAKQNKRKEIQILENSLLNRRLDFSAEYMTVGNLHELIRRSPEYMEDTTIQALTHVLVSKTHISQKQSFFLYREAADCLATIPVLSKRSNLSIKALEKLKNIVSTTAQMQHRAASEALGKLPVVIHGPSFDKESKCKPADLNWKDIYSQCRIPISAPVQKIGRSFVVKSNKKNNMLIIKTGTRHDSYISLRNEALWMAYLNHHARPFPVRFEIPIPIKINGDYVFNLKSSPTFDLEKEQAETCGIAFWSHPDYFRYPNDHQKQNQLSSEHLTYVISNSARLLGILLSQGINHTAPIPLFHNRVQQRRRSDQGRYEWPRGGRLDQWLHSSRYPNFGVSGIRDFEHLEPLNGHLGKPYEYIGTHILSLVLVIGSYFRHKQPETRGFDNSGRPVDLRHLFDKKLFSDLLWLIFINYYKGFAGHEFQDDPPFDAALLADCLIEQMGVDRHMEEILRTADRNEMSDEELNVFLSSRGFSQNEIAAVKTVDEDIIIHTGPHLGQFNRRISVPLLITYLETCAALCIWGKYCGI